MFLGLFGRHDNQSRHPGAGQPEVHAQELDHPGTLCESAVAAACTVDRILNKQCRLCLVWLHQNLPGRWCLCTPGEHTSSCGMWAGACTGLGYNDCARYLTGAHSHHAQLPSQYIFTLHRQLCVQLSRSITRTSMPCYCALPNYTVHTFKACLHRNTQWLHEGC